MPRTSADSFLHSTQKYLFKFLRYRHKVVLDPFFMLIDLLQMS
jgi:hypothetical protein